MLALILIIGGLIAAALVALSVGPLRRLNPVSQRVWWGLVALTLGRFWLLDLCEARFQVVLLLIPAGVAVGHAIWRDVLGRLVGGAGALSVLWVLLFRRMEHSGCSGVSLVYEETLIVLLGLLLLGAPLAIGHMLRRPEPDLAGVFD